MEMELWDKPGKLKQCGLTVMMMTTMTTLVSNNNDEDAEAEECGRRGQGREWMSSRVVLGTCRPYIDQAAGQVANPVYTSAAMYAQRSPTGHSCVLLILQMLKLQPVAESQ